MTEDSLALDRLPSDEELRRSGRRLWWSLVGLLLILLGTVAAVVTTDAWDERSSAIGPGLATGYLVTAAVVATGRPERVRSLRRRERLEAGHRKRRLRLQWAALRGRVDALDPDDRQVFGAWAPVAYGRLRLAFPAAANGLLAATTAAGAVVLLDGPVLARMLGGAGAVIALGSLFGCILQIRVLRPLVHEVGRTGPRR